MYLGWQFVDTYQYTEQVKLNSRSRKHPRNSTRRPPQACAKPHALHSAQIPNSVGVEKKTNSLDEWSARGFGPAAPSLPRTYVFIRTTHDDDDGGNSDVAASAADDGRGGIGPASDD
jgi:hypothetical protein